MSLFDLLSNEPLNLDHLETIMDPAEYNREVHNAIRQKMKDGGFLSPTENVTNFNMSDKEDPDESFGDWMLGIMQRVTNKDPSALDKPGGKDAYFQRRFEFITSHEGWRKRTYKDSRLLRTVGYGFNLEEPTNRDVYKKALGKTDTDYDALRDRKTTLTKREGRILFEAAAGAAETLISNTFADVDLKGYQRLALVSLAYNHPKLIGPNLTKHVKAGDADAVIEEIRLRSNLHKIPGITNRRAEEADMFSGMSPDDAKETEWSLGSLLGFSRAEAATMTSSDDLIENGRDRQPVPYDGQRLPPRREDEVQQTEVNEGMRLPPRRDPPEVTARKNRQIKRIADYQQMNLEEGGSAEPLEQVAQVAATKRNPMAYVVEKLMGTKESTKEGSDTLKALFEQLLPSMDWGNMSLDSEENPKTSFAWCATFISAVLSATGNLQDNAPSIGQLESDSWLVRTAKKIGFKNKNDATRALAFEAVGTDIPMERNAQSTNSAQPVATTVPKELPTGSLVIFDWSLNSDEKGGHAAFYAGRTQMRHSKKLGKKVQHVLVLGGNQANTVKLSWFPVPDIKSMKKLNSVPEMSEQELARLNELVVAS